MTSTLSTYIKSCLNDPWVNTPYEGYVYLTPKQKGHYGELFVSEFMENMLCTVDAAPSSTAGHDRVIDGIRVEIKFSLAVRKGGRVKPNTFVINHVSVGKDWERLIFCGINPEGMTMFYITKEDFITELNRDDSLFHHQQGGKTVNNDDYMCTNVSEFSKREYVSPITAW